MSEKRYTIAVDFDGVVHSYTTPWVAPEVIPDPPVAGAVAWLREISKRFDVVIFTTRARTIAGVAAVRQYLTDWGVTEAVGWEITHEKVPALVYVDDRGYRFTGDNFPTTDQIHRELVPWNKTTGRAAGRSAAMSDPSQTRGVTVSLRARLTVAEDALRAICDPGCMVTHDEEGGSWIDTAIPGNIALKTLRELTEMEAAA